MNPSIGRIVHYTLTEQDADAVNSRRSDSGRHAAEHRENANGVQVHTGNPTAAGDVFPMLITRVWPGETLVQGQVFLDGNDALWVTSVSEGTGPRTYAWPPRI
ncbi:MAG: hypothetical protein M0Z51_16675 [Propionibacterium sp.]|nr:hypothetical protein [Propionibacterium sp.]